MTAEQPYPATSAEPMDHDSSPTGAPNTQPSADVVPEKGVPIDTLLVESKGQFGAVAKLRLKEPGLAAIEYAQRGIVANDAVAHGHIKTMKLIRAEPGVDLPVGPTSADQTASSVSSFLKQHKARMYSVDQVRLTELLEKLRLIASDSVAQDLEEAEVVLKSDELLAKFEDLEGGVYVYTLPHFLRHPTVEGSARTYFKVGKADKQIRERVFGQITAMPEEPLILRVYQSAQPGVTPASLEKMMHKHLAAAEHGRKEPGRSGTEWFETTLVFLDSAAQLAGLVIHENTSETIRQWSG